MTWPPPMAQPPPPAPGQAWLDAARSQEIEFPEHWPTDKPAAEMWVVFSFSTTQVMLRSGRDLATTPISGRDSIFARAAVEQQDVTKATVVGVYRTEDEAVQAAGEHGEAEVQGPFAVGAKQGAPTPQTGPQIVPCRECKNPVGDGTGLCGNCRASQWKRQASHPDNRAAYDEALPLPRVPDGAGGQMSPSRVPTH